MKAKFRLKQLGENEEKELRFASFINEIIKGNVLLVVGRGFELNPESLDPEEIGVKRESKVPNVYDYILSKLNETYGTNAQSLTDLSYHKGFVSETGRPVSIYAAIRSVIEESEFDINDVSPKLIELLSTGYFKYVFTTSFDPLVEIAMRHQWGDNIRIMSIRDQLNKDIENEKDLNIPTLYYLFGAADKSMQKFVATDNDALEVLKIWQKDMYDSKLLNFTSSKYLLTLGCDYDDWLFRFIWYTLRDNDQGLQRGCVSDFSINENLKRYLNQNNVLIDSDVEGLVNKIIKALPKSLPLTEAPTIPDVFISYARVDQQIAQEIYDTLTNIGLNVWFDKYNLAGHGEPYMNKIFAAIDTCKIFVPILTSTLTQQYGKNHPYREEWKRAEKIQIQRGQNFDYCKPVCILPYNLEEAIQRGEIYEWIKERDTVCVTTASELNEWAENVKRSINVIKNRG